MVIRGTLKSIRKLLSLTAEHTVKANKRFLYKITAILSTRRVHNLEVDSDQSENSAFMISIEEKLPQETFLIWEDHKILSVATITAFDRPIKDFTAYFVRWMVIILDRASFPNTTELIKREHVSNTKAALAVLRLLTINLTHAPYKRECVICKRFHHCNLHPRKYVIKYDQNKEKTIND